MTGAPTASWSVGGGSGSAVYRLFDLARNALNVRLARRLYRAAGGRARRALATLEAGSGPGYCSSRLRAMGAALIETGRLKHLETIPSYRPVIRQIRALLDRPFDRVGRGGLSGFTPAFDIYARKPPARARATGAGATR
jgi:hypothetical protein